jgi:oligopeptide transport system substrate-binding protein
MKKILFAFSCSCALLLVVFFALQKKPKLDRSSFSSISLNIVSEPASLDPRKARTLGDLNVIKMCLEGLTRTSKDLLPALALAESITASDDLLSYTITLKKAYWSDGQLIKAKDFTTSWKTSLDPSFPSDYAFMLYSLKNAEKIKKGELTSDSLGVSLLDEKTFTVFLEKPTPQFFELVSHPIWFPIPSHKEQQNPRWAESATTYISSGPFAFSHWQHGNKIILKKNPSYWDADVVNLDQITLHMVSAETGFSMFLAGELDLDGSPFSTLPLDALASLKKENKLLTQDFLISYFLRTNVCHPFLASKNLRKALALSLNRKDIIEHVMMGNGVYASCLVPSCLLQKQEELFIDNNSSLAQEYLKKAQEEDGLSLKDLNSLKLSFFSSEKSFRICQALQQQWRASLGILIELEPLEGKLFFSNVSRKNYQLALGSWVADFRDPINFLEVFRNKSIGTNNTNWESSAFTSALDKSYQEKNAFSRNSLLLSCETLLIEDMPIIPICFGKMCYLKKDSIQNIIISDTGTLDIKFTNIESPNSLDALKIEPLEKG